MLLVPEITENRLMMSIKLMVISLFLEFRLGVFCFFFGGGGGISKWKSYNAKKSYNKKNAIGFYDLIQGCFTTMYLSGCFIVIVSQGSLARTAVYRIHKRINKALQHTSSKGLYYAF